MTYPMYDLVFYFMVYSFLGWVIETVIYAVKERRFARVGILSMPFILSYGVTMVILVQVLPSFGENMLGEIVMCLIVSTVIEALTQFVFHKVFKLGEVRTRRDIFGGEMKMAVAALGITFIFFMLYSIVQPVLVFLTDLMPVWLTLVIDIVLIVALLIDFITVLVATRKGEYRKMIEGSGSEKLGNKLADGIWSRLEKAYPGIRESNEASTGKGKAKGKGKGKKAAAADYTFAEGLSFDKLFWIMIIFGFLGAIIEFFYVGLVDHMWSSRASTLYLPVSLVWGGGAALITLVLLPISQKNDRWTFIGGFVFGGAFEYICSVITELMFGRTFWDYSHMPFNINGRTNLLFCFFWGIIGVIWIKVGYPWFSKLIEKIPPVAGKVITSALIIAIILDASLTIMAILRYNDRQIDTTQHSSYEVFLDTHYPDSLIEHRWPNMVPAK